MSDKSLPLIVQAGVPGLLASLLQLGMALAIGRLPPPVQLVGAIIVAGLVGGGVSVALVEGMHLSSTLAGIVGAATGAVPAIFWSSIAQSVARQQVRQRLGVDPSEITTAPTVSITPAGAAAVAPLPPAAETGQEVDHDPA